MSVYNKIYICLKRLPVKVKFVILVTRSSTHSGYTFLYCLFDHLTSIK